jgi:hypothetical protein
MRRNVLTSVWCGSVLLFSACSDTECSEGQKKVGTTCVTQSKSDASAATAASRDGGEDGSENVAATSGARDAAAAMLEPSGDAATPPLPSDAATSASAPQPDADAGSKTGQATPDAAASAPSEPTQTPQPVPTPTPEPTPAPAPTPLPTPAPTQQPACVPSTEFCDGEDNNCNAQIDEDPHGAPIWFKDCDGDGYAASMAAPVSACVAPAVTATCKGWIEVEPSGIAYTDCDPNSATYHPGAGYGLPAGTNPSNDLNCNSTTEVETSFTSLDGNKYPVCQEYGCDCYIPMSWSTGVISDADSKLWQDWMLKEIFGTPAPRLPCAKSSSDQIQFGKLVPNPEASNKCLLAREADGLTFLLVEGRQLCR